MPANSRWDLIRRLRVNLGALGGATSQKVAGSIPDGVFGIFY